MHVHGNFMNSNAASIYSAAAAEKAASAQRAADVRRKLMESTPNIDGDLNTEDILVRQWSEQNSHKRQDQNPPRAPEKNQSAAKEPAGKPKIQNTEEEQTDKPISTWA